MVQFYFLSVLVNVCAGIILVYGIDFTKASEENSLALSSGAESEGTVPEEKKSSFKNMTGINGRLFRFVTGVMCIVIGFMKVLSVFKGDVPVIGDLLPFAAGVGAGISLLLEYFLTTTTEEVEIPPAVSSVFVDSRKYIGVLAIVAGILHFLLPQVLLL